MGTPLLTHWIYHSLALSHRCDIWGNAVTFSRCHATVIIPAPLCNVDAKSRLWQYNAHNATETSYFIFNILHNKFVCACLSRRKLSGLQKVARVQLHTYFVAVRNGCLRRHTNHTISGWYIWGTGFWLACNWWSRLFVWILQNEKITIYELRWKFHVHSYQ